jgi:diacylglycerol kinase family enzyme
MIANGAYTGGGMNLAPHARLNDQQLDVLLMHAQTVPQRLMTFPKIYSGRHIGSPKFSYFHAKHIRVDTKEDVLLEADGELLGYPPCDIEIIESGIQVFTNSKLSQSSVEPTEHLKKEGSYHEKIMY